MRPFLIALAFCGMTMLGGCALADLIFGTNAKGESKPSVISTIASTVLNGIFPGSGAVFTGLGGLYAAWRGNRWKKAYKTTADVIEEHGDAPKAALKEKLAAAHKKAGVSSLVAKQLKKDKIPAPTA